MMRFPVNGTVHRLASLAALMVAIGSHTAAHAAVAAPSSVTPPAEPAPTQPGTPQPVARPPVPQAQVNGFRGAHFGMTEAEVRTVISHDFGVPASAIQVGENSLQRTHLLNVIVPNLMPDAGRANVTYVFGYHDRKLIAVNILWSKITDPALTPQQIYNNGQTLQQYFAAENFAPERSTGNVSLPGGILLFRSADQNNNVVLLALSGTAQKDKKQPERTDFTPTALSLAYTQNPEHADIFRINKGSF